MSKNEKIKNIFQQSKLSSKKSFKMALEMLTTKSLTL